MKLQFRLKRTTSPSSDEPKRDSEYRHAISFIRYSQQHRSYYNCCPKANAPDERDYTTTRVYTTVVLLKYYYSTTIVLV